MENTPLSTSHWTALPAVRHVHERRSCFFCIFPLSTSHWTALAAFKHAHERRRGVLGIFPLSTSHLTVLPSVRHVHEKNSRVISISSWSSLPVIWLLYPQSDMFMRGIVGFLVFFPGKTCKPQARELKLRSDQIRYKRQPTLVWKVIQPHKVSYL